jgi:hypothetical protein
MRGCQLGEMRGRAHIVVGVVGDLLLVLDPPLAEDG